MKLDSGIVALAFAALLGLLSVLKPGGEKTPVVPDPKTPVVDKGLAEKVQAAFAGDKAAAVAYAGFFEAIADCVAGDDPVPDVQAAAVKAREKMKLSNESLKPVLREWLGKYDDVKQWTPELRMTYSAAYRELGAACRAVK